MYIAIEGIGGVGKSTQIRLLTARLMEEGRKVKVYREPGGTVVGEKLREMVISKDLRVNPRAQLHMFAASRFQLVEEEITPAEADGNVVISDRCLVTSYAYQGHAQDVGFDTITRIHQGLRWPDLVILLDGDPEICLSRRRPDKDRYQGLDFYTKAREGYLLADRLLCNTHTFCTLTTRDQTSDEVFDELLKWVLPGILKKSTATPQ